ncbi:homeobox protein cut isoform X3 [Atheta coriaria]|uniref:homeobox protein cut isoform X3 n=1 Tax=Dalotia coriaria TaxID=877792 RepID=UPI0031F38143
MQPTATATIPPPADMDLQAMQSMDWLFKKERIYLLAQFWQQRATLAEKEVSTLKEQLATGPSAKDSSSAATAPSTPTHNNEAYHKEMERNAYENEIAAKEKENTQLLEEVQRLQVSITSSMSQISRLEEQLEQKRQLIARLETKLDAQRDYDDLKRELSILRTEIVGIEKSPANLVEALIERSKQQQQQQQQERCSSPNSDTEGVTKPPLGNNLDAHLTLPPSLPARMQNVEQFGVLLGEEIVAKWRRSLDASLISSSSADVTPATPTRSPPPPPVAAKTSVTPSVTPTPTQVATPHPATTPASLSSANTDAKSTASTPQPMEAQPSPLALNGGPKSPEDNNNHHLSNNNLPPMAASATAAMLNMNFLRASGGAPDDLKPTYRFDDPHRTYRYAEELGLAPGSMVSRLGESLIPKGDPMEAKLQEMLRYNMDKYANQNLDTLHISRRVRELLSIHNIGQRLFAKYILGLSQGTVSELLSKPKPWDKLTEKGRDSYRKMHAWACDDHAVMVLKSLIPKKDYFSSSGKESSGGAMPPFGARPDADLTDERLAHILTEAQHMQMKNAVQEPDSFSNDDSKSPHGQCLSPFSKDSSQNRRLKKYENDDIPQEKVYKIYQEELAKIMGKDMRGAGAFQGGNPLDRTQDEIRMTLEAYHREMIKLNQGPGLTNLGILALQQQAQAFAQQNPLNGGVQDLSIPKEVKIKNGDEKEKNDEDKHNSSAFSLVRPKPEPTTPLPNSTASSPLGNSILPPATSEEFCASSVASPLQRMASITNSLISQPASQPHHNSSQRPLKAVLPPITQQQFDMYNNLNTEDIVKKVKEQLSQYSISQRLFGESVLGLSQGSVSDLLARPKPWHMLTQKGREPFIRMKMFLEDDNAVHKLVASQYKIAPEKLMRTGGYGGSCSTISKPLPPKMICEAAAAGLFNKMQQEQQNLLPPSLHLQHQNPQPPPPPMLLTPPGVPPHHAISLQNSAAAAAEHMKKTQSPHIQHSPVGSAQSAMRSLHQHISPSVYEMAALTQDLDTQIITTKIKEALLANNIGQKIFGEAVLGLSQGSVSELLSKPKPWHMLSIKGREPFIRMQLWLNDAHNIDRLQALKNERREANKRRRSSGAGAHDNSSDTSSNDTSEFYHSNSPGPGPPSAKKQRVLFSEEQKEALRLAFVMDPYPNVTTIEFLAQELNLSSRTITNWFHNHRMRLKQQVPHGLANDLPPRDQTGGQPPFDPMQFRLLLNQRLIELSKERMGLGGVGLPYPPYLATNPNLAALISRGILPTGDELAALNNAVKEQISGLDLSMGNLKREPGDFDDEDECESNAGSEDSNISSRSMHHQGEPKPEPKETPVQARSSRRKPAAPQWVNPEWQDEKEKPATGDEVIINGVCVMQTEDYGRRNSEETVRVEPTPVMDRYEDDQSDASSVRSQQDPMEIKSEREDPETEEADVKSVKNENDEERWDY